MPRFLPESLNHDSFWSAVRSTHPWKKAESRKSILWTGMGDQGFFCALWSCWREAAMALNSSGQELRLHSSTPPKCMAHLAAQQTGKPQKGKQCAALPQRPYQLIQGISNNFGSFHWYSNLLFSSHTPSVPKQHLRDLKIRAPRTSC